MQVWEKDEGNPMTKGNTIGDYITSLRGSPRFAGQVIYHHEFPPEAPSFGEPAAGFAEPIVDMMRKTGVDRLYAHQAAIIDRIRHRQHVVAATPTASGKTLCYVLPVFESLVGDPTATSLFLYPLKALAQDQHKKIKHMASHLAGITPTAEIYDGDTSAYRRRKIRDMPPNVLLTNPEMVHLSILPHHERWQSLLSRLAFVVVDEVHTYRGILGSHMAQVFRRLIRICRRYGSQPTFVFSSATVANPGDLATQLTGFEVMTVDRSTAGTGRRHLVLVEPVDGPLAATLMLLKAALGRGLRTIVYTQSRKLTELLAIWAQNQAGDLKGRISAYRAGFYPRSGVRSNHGWSPGIFWPSSPPAPWNSGSTSARWIFVCSWGIRDRSWPLGSVVAASEGPGRIRPSFWWPAKMPWITTSSAIPSNWSSDRPRRR